ILNLLVTGGSQGSRALNRVLRQSWPIFRQKGFPVRIFHQTGNSEFESIREEFTRAGLEGEIVPFIADMTAAFDAADLIVSRSGAGTVSELVAAGKPSILVPFPYAADDHQTRNAEAMQNAGAARMIPDAEMNGEILVDIVGQLSDSLDRMGAAARSL